MSNYLEVETGPSSSLRIEASESGDNDEPYTLGEGFAFGGTAWRRNTAVSPFLPGRVLVSAVKDVSSMAIPVIVAANSPTNLRQRIAVLVEAFSQFAYALDFYHDVEGETPNHYGWVCEPADYTPMQGNITGPTATCSARYWQRIVFVVPYSPPAPYGPF